MDSLQVLCRSFCFVLWKVEAAQDAAATHGIPGSIEAAVAFFVQAFAPGTHMSMQAS
eukprot:jgi/Botrbrau1/2042/Bobra.0047s0019.1